MAGAGSDYDVFVSYSHDLDRDVAAACQRVLQGMRRRYLGRPALRVFRDDTSLTAGTDLWNAIAAPLAGSRFFLLVASPRASASPWVEREITSWLAAGHPVENLLIVLADGEIAWSRTDFDWRRTSALSPRALAGAFRAEPLWVDLRWARGRDDLDENNVRLRDAIATIAAPIHGVPKDELESADIRELRRGKRLRGIAVAALSALLALALVLGVLIGVSNHRLSTALDTANARTLGQLSAARLADDPQTATQLALAATAADPEEPEARSALGQAYLARRSTVATHQVPGTERVGGILTGSDLDGATLLVTEGSGVVADGLTGPGPRFQPVPGLDATTRPGAILDHGRFVLVGDRSGRVQLWDRTGGSPPRALPGSQHAAFVLDDTHLLAAVAVPGGTELRREDVVTGETTTLTTLPDTGVDGVWATPDPNRVLVSTGDPTRAPSGPSTLTRRDAHTGAVLATLPAGTQVALGGQVTVRCLDSAEAGTESGAGAGAGAQRSTLVVDDAADGTVRRMLALGPALGLACGHDNVMVTGDGGHVAYVESGHTDPSGVDRVEIVDLADGRRSSVWVPTAAGLDASSPRSVEQDGQGGRGLRTTKLLSVHGDRAVLVDNDAVDTLTLSGTPSWRDANPDDGVHRSSASLGPDGSYALEVRSTSGSLTEAVTMVPATGAVLGRLGGDQLGLAPGEPFTNGGTVDDQHFFVLTGSPTGPRVHEYSMPDLRPTGVYDLGAAGAGGLAPVTTASFPGLAWAPGRFVVLSGGVLSWWSTDTHQLVAPPVTVTTDPVTADRIGGQNQSLTLADPAGDAVAYQDPDGITTWSLSSRRATHVTADVVTSTGAYLLSAGRLSTLEVPRSLVQRAPGTGAMTAPPVGVGALTEILGIDPDGHLVVNEGSGSSGSTLTFWNAATNQTVGRLQVPANPLPVGSLENGRWDVDTGTDLVAIPLAESVWRDALCRAQSRPYTPAERGLLPPGAATDEPCGS